MIHLQDLSDVRTGRPTASPTTSHLATGLRLLLLDLNKDELELETETRTNPQTEELERKLVLHKYSLECGCTTAWLDAIGRCCCEQHGTLLADVSDQEHLVLRHVLN